MNMKRVLFWFVFAVIMVLIVLGLIAAMNKPPKSELNLSLPAPIVASDHVLGAYNAPITLVEYADFQCPACAFYFPMVEKLLSEASMSTRFVYRHYPLFPLPHKNAVVASQAAEAAGEQGKFWDMHRLLFENQTEWSESDNAIQIFETYAERLGLNTSTFRHDFNRADVKDRIQANHDDGVKIGVNSTPTFFVNGKPFVGKGAAEEADAEIRRILGSA